MRKSSAAGARILRGVRCSVVAINEDGIDSSAGLSSQLRDMGAIVDGELRQGHTHLVWSPSLGSSDARLALAAQLLGCKVVSPLWARECVRTRRLLPEDGYAVDVEYYRRRTSLASPANGKPTRDLEPTGAVVNASACVTNVALATKRLSNACDKVGRLSREAGDAEAAAAPIPLPSFREINPSPVLLDSSRRRSIRISDHYSVDAVPAIQTAQALTLDLTPAREVIQLIRADTVFALVVDEAELLEARTLKGSTSTSTSTSKKKESSKRASKVVDAVGGDESPSIKPSKRPRTSPAASNQVMPNKQPLKHKPLGVSRPLKVASKASASAQQKSLLPKNAVLGLTGFNAEECDTLSSLVKVLSGRYSTQLRIESDASAPYDAVIAEDRKDTIRTLKIVFALARGVPVITRDWLYCSLDGLADPALFRHPRYSCQAVGVPLKLLQGRRVMLTSGVEAGAALVGSLVSELGGIVTQSLREADLVIVGDSETLQEAVAQLLKRTKTSSKDILSRLAGEGKVVRLKHLLDCVEAGKWRQAREELVLRCSEAAAVQESALTSKSKSKRSAQVVSVAPARESPPKISSRVGFREQSPFW